MGKCQMVGIKGITIKVSIQEEWVTGIDA